MTRTQIATADFSCGGMQKGTNNGDESDERLRTENSYINNRHKHTIIATLLVKKGSKFTDPDAQFPRGGALACARGFPFNTQHNGYHCCPIVLLIFLHLSSIIKTQ